MSGRGGYAGARRKLMISTGLERFFEPPIISAPKRNLKLYNEMWTNLFLPRAFGRTERVCAASRCFDERDARFLCWT